MLRLKAKELLDRAENTKRMISQKEQQIQESQNKSSIHQHQPIITPAKIEEIDQTNHVQNLETIGIELIQIKLSILFTS